MAFSVYIDVMTRVKMILSQEKRSYFKYYLPVVQPGHYCFESKLSQRSEVDIHQHPVIMSHNTVVESSFTASILSDLFDQI